MLIRHNIRGRIRQRSEHGRIAPVTTPRQFEQSPFCGPEFWSRARFQSDTLRAQFRVAPIKRFSAFQARSPANIDPTVPKHSVNQMSLLRKAIFTVD
jgi:hypothetical protein